MTLLTLSVVLLTAVLVAVCWNRFRIIGRSVLVLAAVVSVAAATFVQVNRVTQLVAAPPEPSSPSSGSQLLTVTVPGRLTLPMYVYLPAAYRTGEGRFPVIEALHGFVGTPQFWIRSLHVQATLDREIAAGRMAPTVVLFPTQTPQRLLDTECTDLRGGPQAEIYLTADVPAFARAHFRVRDDRESWGLTGYSAGGFCATNLLLRHPDRYAAAASMSGYASPGIAVGDGSEKTTNNPAWRLRHLPQPPVALWLGWAGDDAAPARDSRLLASECHSPLAVTTAEVAFGGHSGAVWRQMEPPAFDWLSAHLARPSS
ncbi:alpha/beta hydrolase-fold protein [Actinoplanes missouriensis]|uniref:alpha/beta hydrolase n=1 Tax=Actinoplanes missouriensis TaxID=1866 RepID=UPI00340FD412